MVSAGALRRVSISPGGRPSALVFPLPGSGGGCRTRTMRARRLRSTSVQTCCWCGRPIDSSGIFRVAASDPLRPRKQRRGVNWLRKSVSPRRPSSKQVSSAASGTADATGCTSLSCARPGRLPTLHFDNREIVEARLMSPAELDSVLLPGPVAAYLGRMPARVCQGLP